MFTSIIHTQESFVANDSERKPFHIEDDGSGSGIGRSSMDKVFFFVSLGTRRVCECVSMATIIVEHKIPSVLLNHRKKEMKRRKNSFHISRVRRKVFRPLS